jgi:GNAT superfamily N-acetyltransferase
VELERPKRWCAQEVTYLFVRPDYRKLGVASHLYDIILNDDVLLMSGWSQNPKSKGLWMKLIKEGNYTIWAQDILDLDRICQVFFDEDGELVTNLKLYHDIHKKPRRLKTDVRLFAMKRDEQDLSDMSTGTRKRKR